MKSRISALMDGELGSQESAGPLGALRGESEALDAWKTYHLISDVLRGTRPLSDGFAERLMARLADEPTVLAPGAGAAPARGVWFGVSAAAASVAAVALVGWLAFGPPGAQAPAPVVQAVPAAAPTAVAAAVPGRKQNEPVRVPLPAATDDYLLAHQGYSPRNSLQGMAPYVRTASGSAGARKP
jgi:sigma-E factor negative regulatory protein RseA